MEKLSRKTLKRLPSFATEVEEREFWLTHDTTEYFEDTKTERVRFPNLKPTTPATSPRSTGR